MSVIATGDLHWSDNHRDAYRHEFVGWLSGCLEEHKPEALFLLGDLTEAKDEHQAWLTNTVVGHIARLASYCPVIIIRGNHDAVNPDWPFFRFVDEIDNVFWINQPSDSVKGALSAISLGIGRYLCLPHTTDHERDWAEFKNLAKYTWIFTHNTFSGADYGRGQLAKGIPLSVIPSNSVQVVSGDVHVPQKVGPVTYVGAPYTIDFGDDYKPRVALIKGDKMAFIPTQGAQKRLVEVSSLADLKKVKLAKGDIVKVRVNLATEDRTKWPEMQTAIKEWSDKQGVVLSLSQPMVDRDPGRKRKLPITDDKQLIREYIKQRGADPVTERVGLRLMERV